MIALSMERIKKIAISPNFLMHILIPDGILSDYISMIWASDGTPPFKQERIIPDGSSVMIFNFGNPIYSEAKLIQKNIIKTLFTGVFTHFSQIKYDEKAFIHRQIGIIFKPGGTFPFIQTPLDEFKNIATEITNLESQQYNELYEKLGEETSIEKRIIIIENFLINTLKKKFEKPILNDLINLIKKNPHLNIQALIQKTGYSQQQVNRILGKYAGTNAKGFQKIFRINASMESIRANYSQENLIEIAFENNYFDQSHFIHDFKEMTGMTPKEYKLIQHPTTNRVIYM